MKDFVLKCPFDFISNLDIDLRRWSLAGSDVQNTAEHYRRPLAHRASPLIVLFYLSYHGVVPLGFLQWEIRVDFPRESQLRQSRATQPTVHAECFCVSLIHWALTWATGSLTCAHMLMHAIAHGGYRHSKRVCTDSWLWEKKIPCRPGESNLRQRRAGPTFYQLSYIPTLHLHFHPQNSSDKSSPAFVLFFAWAIRYFSLIGSPRAHLLVVGMLRFMSLT